MVAGFMLICFHPEFFLIAFAALFFSVLLTASATRIAQWTKLGHGLSLALAILLITGLLTGIVLLLGPSISDQVNQMIDTIPRSLANLKDRIASTELGARLFRKLPDDPSDLIRNKRAVVAGAMGSLGAGLSILANFFIILITGIFLAVDPKLYKTGFLRLFPVHARPRLGQVMGKIHETLSLWMLAKLISMTVVGVASAVGLTLLGIPLPYALALIAALCSFIPNIGPYIALVPAVLIAFLEGADKALYVVILYFSIQIVETYLITPFVERKMVALPPALTLMWMVLLGTLTGVLGLVLAAPILAAFIVIIGELYVKDKVEQIP